MTIPLFEFAHQLNLHPANTLLYLRSLAVSFDQVWPDVDQALLESVRRLDWARFGSSKQEPHFPSEVPSDSVKATRPINPNAVHILDKLARSHYWGANKAARDKIKNHFCPTVADISPDLAELEALGFLQEWDGGHSYSLDSSKKGEIEEILKKSRGPQQS